MSFRIPHIILRLLILCLAAGLSACEEAPWLQRTYSSLMNEMSEPDPCDPSFNIYVGETHFIERDFLKEDGTIDYEKWVRIADPQSSPCDPLNTAAERRRREQSQLENGIAE